MTNKDKYLKDGVDVEELASEINELMLFCQNYVQPFRACLVEFFKKEVKPTLTEDEKVILRNIPKDYVKIRRAKWIIDEKIMNYGQLEIVDDKGNFWTLCILSHLFRFIKERRRI